MQKTRLQINYAIFKVLYYFSIVIGIVCFAFLFKTLSVILLFVHVIVIGAFLRGACRYFGWVRYEYDYVKVYGHFIDFEKLLVRHKNNKNAKVLESVVLLTGNVANTDDDCLKRLIAFEDSIFDKATGDFVESGSLDELSQESNNGWWSHLIPILSLIDKKDYDVALKKLDLLISDSPYSEIPRQFYYAYASIKRDGQISEEAQSCIDYVLNMGRETRYARYLSKMVDNVEETNPVYPTPWFYILFFIYLCWCIVIMCL